MNFKIYAEKNGKKKEFIVNARNANSAKEEAQQNGYTNISIKEIKAKKAEGKVNSITLYQAFIQVYYLRKANITISECLVKVAQNEKNKILKYAFMDIAEKTANGQELSVAFAEHRCFPPTVIVFMKIAESIGNMDEVLKEICIYFKQMNFISSSISRAFRSSKYTLAMALLVFIGLTYSFIPQMKLFYADSGITLPLISKIVYATSDFMTAYWWMCLLGLSAFVYFFMNTKTLIPETHDKFLADCPAVKDLMRDIYMFKFLKSLQMLVTGNKEIISALQITADHMENGIYRNIVMKASLKVEAGFNLKDAIEKSDPDQYFDNMCLNFIESGSESGNLAELLREGSIIYTEKIEDNVDKVERYLSIGALIISAILIGSLIAAVILPTFRLHQIIGH